MPDTVDDLIRRAAGSAPPLCAGLIDQDRHVGSDPVGHACGNVATCAFWSGGVYWAVCRDCLRSLAGDDGRVTLPTRKAREGDDG